MERVEVKPRVMVIGLGPIGLACARAIRAESDIKLVGLVDNDQGMPGKTVDEIAGRPGPGDQREASLRIVSTVDEITEPVDLAVVTAHSRFHELLPLLDTLIGRGVSVVSSCEELVWPWYRHEAQADALNQRALDAGVTLLGTGVNPGFAMDLLPITLASMVRRVAAVRCVRRVDAMIRRDSLQAKIGLTLTTEKFAQLQAQGRIGHVGLAESLAMLAYGLGRRVPAGTIQETLEPIIAEQPTPSALGLIAQGRVAGLVNTVTWEGQGLRLELSLTMAAGLTDPKDVIEIDGPVQLRMKIPGSLPGDSGTVAALLNSIPVVHRASAGLKTVLDVPPSGCHNRDWEPDNPA